MSTSPRSLHDFVTTAQSAVLGNVSARRQIAELLGGMSVEAMSDLLLSVCAGVDLRDTPTARPAGFIDPDRISDAQCWHALGLYEDHGVLELPVLLAALEHYRRQAGLARARGSRERRDRIATHDARARGLRLVQHAADVAERAVRCERDS